jgi:NADPH:quinone reductase-like Zn-dependent oxidoreductase
VPAAEWELLRTDREGARRQGHRRLQQLEDGLVRDLGADEVIDYTREDLSARRRSYDVIIDTAGNRALRNLRPLLTARGRLVLIGGES